MAARRRAVNADVRPDVAEGGWDAIAAEPSPGPTPRCCAWARSLVAIAVTSRLETLCGERMSAPALRLVRPRDTCRIPIHPPSWRDVGRRSRSTKDRSRAETAARHFRALLAQSHIASDLGSEEDIDNELQAVIALL
jgi:hypothetical protein